MKLHLPRLLRSAVLASLLAVGASIGSAATTFTAPTDLGDTMFIGDSISHGRFSNSYRWELHKIFTDNAITYNEVGVHTGNYTNGVNPSLSNLIYGSSMWKNCHAAYFGQYASEIAGGEKISGSTLGNIRQWLNLETPNGNYHIDESVRPSTYFMLIGTNDLRGQVRPSTKLEELQKNLLGTKTGDTWDGLGNMDTIISTMREKSGKNANIVLLTVPTWYAKGYPDDTADDLKAVSDYNKALDDWAAQNNVTLVKSDKGIIDVAAEWEGQGVMTMYRGNPDYLHPNAQGDLIIAGNVAKGLGYAGRTAGQKRVATEDFTFKSAAIFPAANFTGTVTQNGSAITFAGSSSLSYAWQVSAPKSFSVDFTLAGLGNGSTNGWNVSDNLSITLGNGSYGGTLNINEAYIQWGDSILYSIDTSAGLDSLRIAYVCGNSVQGLLGGFYVWLDDQLIGEALDSQDDIDGLTITNGTGSDITLSDLAMDDASWAPWSTRRWAANPVLIPIVGFPDGNFPGRKDWCPDNLIRPQGLSMANDLSHPIQSAGYVGGTINTGTQGAASYINQGEFAGDMYITISGDANFTNYWGFHGYRQPNEGKDVAFKGNAYLRIRDLNAPRTFKTFMAVANTVSGSITGDMYFEVSSENVTLQAQNLNSIFSSIVGIYNTNADAGILGEFRIVINSGNIQASIIGGSVDKNGYVNSVAIYINGGQFGSSTVGNSTAYGNIAAGGYYGSVGDRSITITGDEMNLVGCQYMTAGSVTEGNKTYFAASGAADPIATLKEGSTATVTIADVTQEGGFGMWSGILSGGEKKGERSLIFSGATLEQLKATIKDFDSITLSDKSKVGLTSFGGATNVTVDKDSELTVLDTLTAEKLDNKGKVTVSKGKELTVNGVNAADAVTLTGSYILTDSTLNMGSATNGQYTVETKGSSTLSLSNSAKGTYAVLVEEGSLLVLSASGFDGKISLSMSGSGSTISSTSAGTAVLSVDDSTAAGKGVFDLGGNLSITELTLTALSSGSQVIGLGKADDITLAGENNISLGSAMKTKALLDTEAALILDANATLNVQTSAIIEDLKAIKEAGSVDYYLTQGDLTQLLSNGGKMKLDAAFMALNMTVGFTADGALNFAKRASGSIYDSSESNVGNSWGMDSNANIYDSVGGYDAVVVKSSTEINLSEVEVPFAWMEDGLTIHNLIGTEQGELTITGDKNKPTKVTLTNMLSKDAIKSIEQELGVTVEKTLTYAGDIHINDAELQVKHMDPDAIDKGDADSTTVVKGNLTLMGTDGLTLTSGVLQLEGASNDLGSGDVRIAGNDGQLVVGKDATLTVRGELQVQDGADLYDGEREHVRMDGGVLELQDRASVGAGLTLGNENAPLAGTLSAASGEVTIDKKSRLSHVLLHVEENARLRIGSAVQPLSLRTTDEAEWDVAGLTGSGFITGTKDITVTVAGEDRVFSGNLKNYSGTMKFTESNYTQSFVGVKGGDGWNVTNETGGRIVFDLAGEGGSNSLTMGDLTLERGSITSILLDLQSVNAGDGMHLKSLQAAPSASVTIGQYKGMITLTGNEGDSVTLATITVTEDDGSLEKQVYNVDWYLSGIRNADQVFINYDDATRTISLMTLIDNTTTYANYADNRNSLAGARMLWDVENSYLYGGDLAGLDTVVYNLLMGSGKPSAGAVTRANEIMAAAAGAGVPVMGLAFSNDVERQLRAIRNRAASDSRDGESGLNVWLNAETDYYKQDAKDMYSGYKSNSWGGTVGVSSKISEGTSLGLALTAMYGDLRADSLDRLKGDMDTYYVTAFTRVEDGAWRHTFVATVGKANLDVERTVDYGLSRYTTKGSTDGLAFGAMYEVGYNIPLNESGDAVLQPVFNISYRHTSIDGYSETGGSNAALRVGEQELNSVTFGLGARCQTVMDSNFWTQQSMLEVRSLLKVRVGDKAGEASVAFQQHEGALRANVESASAGSVGAEVGAALIVPMGESGDIFVDVSAELWKNYSNINAGVGYRVRF